MNKIKQITHNGLCLGCGLCETIATTKKCKMVLKDDCGFYEPDFLEQLTEKEIKYVLNCCPGIKVIGNKENTVWGRLEYIKEAWSCDQFIRKKASSGGIITTLAIHLIETQKVNAILHVGVRDSSYLYNCLKVSRTKADVLNNMGSRYAPALMFDQLKNVLDHTDEVYAFIGKPCDIAGIKNFIEEFPVYKDRVIYTIAFFCAGIPSYNGTKEALKLSGHTEEPYLIKYRGDGWPGLFEAKYKNHDSLKISYNDSWGKILGKYLGFRCKICPDGIGLLADIAVGDSWNTKNGYPDFEEREGRSFVILRTIKGSALYEDAKSRVKIEDREFDLLQLERIQQYQLYRRVYSGFRILPFQLSRNFLLKFHKLGITRLMVKANLYDGIRNIYGTFKRLIKIAN